MENDLTYSIELHLVGEVKIIGNENDADEVSVGHVSVGLGKVAQIKCKKEDFYLPAPRAALTRVNLDDALEVGLRRTAAVALDLIEGRLTGEALADAIKCGKVDMVGLRGDMTPELVDKLGAAGLRPIMPLTTTSVN